MFNLHVEEVIPGLLLASYIPILEDGVNFNTFYIEWSKPCEDAWPVRFFTATSKMRDFIGNVKEVSGPTCSAEGVIYGTMRVVSGVKMMAGKTLKLGERIMITEHINIDGKLELIATKKRILYGDLNFINIGWSTKEKCDFYRIDAYTGKFVKLTGDPIFGRINDNSNV